MKFDDIPPKNQGAEGTSLVMTRRPESIASCGRRDTFKTESPTLSAPPAAPRSVHNLTGGGPDHSKFAGPKCPLSSWISNERRQMTELLVRITRLKFFAIFVTC